MKYSLFGNTGLVVSRLSFGAMTFGQGRLVGELMTTIDQATADRMTGSALDAGINLFDTADMYTSGQSEAMLGRALRGRRQDVIIATKCGFRAGEPLTDSGLTVRHVLASAEASLRRLDTDYIDLYLLHIPDYFTPLEETARALDHLVRQGKARYVGFCNYPAWLAQKLLAVQEAGGLARCMTAQMYYSLLGRDLEHEFVPFLQGSGLGLMVWSPLAGGFLSGKYTRATPVPEDSRRARFNFPPVDVDKGYAVVDMLQEMADRHSSTVPRIALAWLLAKPWVSTVLVGANKTSQLEDNLAAGDLELPADDVRALDELTEPPQPYPTWMQAMGRDQKTREALEWGFPRQGR